MIRATKSTDLSTALCTATIILLLGMGVFYPSMVNAKEAPEKIHAADLRSLAKDFVTRIGGKLKNYDQQTALGGDGGLSQISDGEFLLLRPKSGKFVIDSEIGAIPNQGKVYFSLEDIISRLELQIDYNPETQVGSGWFLREDWLIRFNFKSKEVVSRGTTFTIADGDVYEDNGDIFISGDAALQWLSIKLKPDLAQQYVDVDSAYPYPALARNYRERDLDGRRKDNVALLPRAENEDKNFDINVLETQQTLRSRRSREGGMETRHNNTTAIAGEIVGHNAYAISNWNNEEKLTSIRGRLTKESENSDLLGPLKARSYTIGDTELPQLPLTGNVSEELGVRINNNPLKNADFQRTTISGDSLPGWDIELYRDGFLIDRIRVEDDGRYEFSDIDLFSGDNLFDVFFYGPQGEIRKDSFNIPVNDQFLATQDNTYDVSLTFNEARTYNKFPNEDEDADQPHLVARYNKLIGNTLAYAGLRAHHEDGEQKAYLGTGFTNIWNGFVFDGNAAVDEKANKALELSTRKTIDDWRLQLIGNLKDEDFDAEGEEDSTLSVLGLASKNFITPFDTRLSLNTSGQYEEFANDSTRTQGTVGLSHQMGRLTLSNSTRYSKTEGGESLIGNGNDEQTRVDTSVAARVSQGRFFTTAGLNYNVKPDQQIDDYFAQFTYYPTNRLSSDLRVSYRPVESLTEGRLSLNYKANKFRVSPYVDVDSESKLETGVRLTTTLVDKPNSALPIMTSERLIGRGLVSSFVFFDKNGNNVFDEGDEPLPDVYVQSMNIARRAPTDAEGYSLIKDLPEKFITDIQVDQSTLPDPFMISGFKGASVFPRSGEMVNLTFPIHLGGEIDGNIFATDGDTKNNAASIPVQLIPLDGTTNVIKTFAAADGYYVISSIPPGNYILSVDAAAANRQKLGGMAPKPVTIGYDGTVFSNTDIRLTEGKTQIPVDVKTVALTDKRVPFFALQTGNRTKGSLADVLGRMIRMKTAFNPDKGLVPLTVEGEENVKIFPGKGLEEHYQRCEEMSENHLPCRVVLFVPKEDPNIKTANK